MDIYQFVPSVPKRGGVNDRVLIYKMTVASEKITTFVMWRRKVYCYGTTIVLSYVRFRSPRGAVIQSDILETHNFVENNYQYDTLEVLQNTKLKHNYRK